MGDGPVTRRIRDILTRALRPDRLEIEDDSARHAGHHHEGGIDARPGGETHFNVLVVASAFAGMSRVERQRMINRLLADELAQGVHALSITARAPGETA